MDVDQTTGQIVTSQLSFARLLTVLQALFEVRVDDQELLAEMNVLVRRASVLEQERNTVVHSAWLSPPDDDPTAPVMRLKFNTRRGRGLQTQRVEETPDGLNGISDRMESLVAELGSFMGGVRDHGYIDYPVRFNPEDDDSGE